MGPRASRALHWTPRVLAILIAGFLSLFAMDVFDEGRGVLETVAALVIHLLPTWLVALALLVAWRRPWLGAISFPALGIAYLVLVWGRPVANATAILLISGPLFLVGALFLLDWRRAATAGEDVPPSSRFPAA